MQKAETDDVILALFFLYKGGFAIVYWISRWVCGNEQQCKNLAPDTWVSSKLPRKALSVPFNHYLCTFLLFHMCLRVQTLPMVLHLQIQKHLLFQRSKISYNREVSSLASGKLVRFFPFFLLLHWWFHFLAAQVPHWVTFYCMQCSEDFHLISFLSCMIASM